MVSLSIHNKCNQFCVFCNTQMLLHKKIWQEPTKQEIIKQVEDAAKKTDNINFTGGGEVTVLPYLPELIRYTKKLGVNKVGIETNGVLLSLLEYVKKLKESGLDYCGVSLHSHKEAVSDWITQSPGTFKHTICGLQNLQKEGIKIEYILQLHLATRFGKSIGCSFRHSS